MKKLWTATFATVMVLIPTGCSKVYNSSSYDAQTYAPPVTGGSPQFTAVKAILDSKCINCHTNYHASWAGYDSAAYVSAGLVTPSSLPSSLIYTKLAGNRTGTGGQNMPDGAAALSGTELDAFEAWIGSL